MRTHLIPAFQDNYFFVVERNRHAMVVDPGEAAPIETFLNERNLSLDVILITHHHLDHIGGLVQLKKKYPHARVFGPDSLKFPVDKVMKEGKQFIFQDTPWLAMHLPGHTLDHLAYFGEQHHILFSGDVLFSFGCGRIFEGTYEQMYDSLSRLDALPPDTLVYCAHEYTERNLQFTLKYAHQENFPLSAINTLNKIEEEIRARRAKNIPTVPTRLDFERQYNLFLRAESLEEFKQLRDQRNRF